MSASTYSWSKSRTTQRRLRDLLAYLLLAVGLVWFIFPLVWVILSSLKTFQDFNQIPARLLPSELYLGNYPRAWNSVPFGIFFLNTTIIVALCVVGELVSASLVGYGFSRLRFWGRNFLFMILLSTMMLPFWVTIIPRFLLYKEIGWIGTWLPLIVPSYFANPHLCLSHAPILHDPSVRIGRRRQNRRLQRTGHLLAHPVAAHQAGAGHHRHLLPSSMCGPTLSNR